MTPACVSESSRDGFASRFSAACAPGLSFFGQRPQAAFANRNQRDFRGSEKAVQQQHGGQDYEAIGHTRAKPRRSNQRYGKIVPVRLIPTDFGRVLKFINLSIAVLLVLVLGAVYWIAYRPLPRTSGANFRAGVRAGDHGARCPGRASHRGRWVGRCDFPARLRDGAGSAVADGCAATAGGRRII